MIKRKNKRKICGLTEEEWAAIGADEALFEKEKRFKDFLENLAPQYNVTTEFMTRIGNEIKEYLED